MGEKGWKIGFILRPFLATVSLVALVAPATGGNRSQAQPPTPKKGIFTISDNVDLVLLDVSVKNPHGGYATGLKKENFAVFEDGQPRKITQFASEDTPVTIGLIVDNSGSMRFKRPEVVVAGLAFAKQSNPLDEFFVVNFNNSVLRGLPDQMLFTDNLQSLRAALYYGEPRGQTALYDAVAYALKHLEFSHRDKRTLVVVSDGGDNVSQIDLHTLLKQIEASRATVYTVGLYDPEDRSLSPGVLRKMSNISGGEFFEPESIANITPVFDKISKDIRQRYTVGFVPDEIKDKRVLRSVKVVAREGDRKLLVRTRTSYINASSAALIAQENRQPAATVRH